MVLIIISLPYREKGLTVDFVARVDANESEFIVGFSCNRGSWGHTPKPDAITFRIAGGTSGSFAAAIRLNMYEVFSEFDTTSFMPPLQWCNVRVRIDKSHFVAFLDGKKLLSKAFKSKPLPGNCHIGIFGYRDNKTQVKRMDIIT